MVLLAALISLAGKCDEGERTNQVTRLSDSEWTVEETSRLFGEQTGPGYYEVQMYTDPELYPEVNIRNFYNLGDEVVVSARMEDRRLVIPPQTVDGFTIEGSGTVKRNLREIRWEYRVDLNDGTEDNVSASYRFKRS